MSPVCSQPFFSVSAVMSGRFQYSVMTWVARTQISPGSPVPTSRSSSSMILTSQAAIGKPQDRNSSGVLGS